MADAAPEGSVTIVLDDCSANLPLKGVIDVAAEKDRLTKAMGKLDKDLNGLRGRLKNPKFAESAPPNFAKQLESGKGPARRQPGESLLCIAHR